MREAIAQAHPRQDRGLSRALLAMLLALSAGGCWQSGRGGPGAVVARVGDEQLTRSELDEYLALNLPQGPEEEAPTDGNDQIDRVKSRLLDAWLDERLLAQEARRRGLSVTEDEVVAVTAERTREQEPSAPGSSEDVRIRIEGARLLIEKLQEQLVEGGEPPSDRELREYLERKGGRLMPGTGLVVRALMFDSAETAAKVYSEIRLGRLGFSEAVAAYETNPGQGVPLALPAESLPAGFRAALERLKPGEVSPPLEFHGDAYLFQVESSTDPEGAYEELTREAVAELEWRRRQQATERLLEALRAKTLLKITHRSLPFSYVPHE